MKNHTLSILKLRGVARLVVLAGLLAVTGAPAANLAYLTLTIKGEVIQGESQTTSLGRSNTIPCFSLESEFYRPGTDTPVVHRPVKFVKPADKATPKIAAGLGDNFTGSAVFRFYQTDINGIEYAFMTVTLAGVKVRSQRVLLPNTLVPSTANQPLLEEVTLSYTSITIHHEVSDHETTLTVDTP